jgi:hypothetical protein
MKLLDTTTLALRDFDLPHIPPYAILSHTWSDEEIDFRKMSALSSMSRSAKKKKGFIKIAKTCELALRHGLAYAWVDTCCINKSSSAELTEAINSMYQFYSGAERCYVYLEDLSSDGSAEEGFPGCRWFTRGWTLQELLAPSDPEKVRFYDTTWKYRGLKKDFIMTLSECTGISEDVLRGTTALTECGVAERMSWAAGRETKRIEDMAYCLLGIFDVNMPLLYGEGLKSFRRLQEEIVKRNVDLTILAWEDPNRRDKTSIGLFAETPAAFLNSSLIEPFNDDFVEFSVTNKGLLVSGETPLRVVSTDTDDGTKYCLYALFFGTSSKYSDNPEGGIYLRKLGPKLFTRDLTLPLAGFGDNKVSVIHHLEDVSDFYILMDPKPNILKISFWNCSLHIPPNESLEIVDTIPETLWDVTNRLFLKPKPYSWTRYPMVIAMTFRGKILGETMCLVVLCDYRGDYTNRGNETSPSCKVFWKGDYPREEALIFRGRDRENSIYWPQLEIDAPHILQLSSTAETRVGKRVISVSASFEKGVVASITAKEDLFSLKFDINQQLYTA